MFIFKGRTLGAVAGLGCALLVTLMLGGCATSPVDDVQSVVRGIERGGVDHRAASEGPRVCARYGPRGDDRRCGQAQMHKAEAMIGGMIP
jgi:hypothetical protein